MSEALAYFELDNVKEVHIQTHIPTGGSRHPAVHLWSGVVPLSGHA